MAVFTAIGAAVFGAGTFLATVTAGALQVAAGIALSLIAKSMAGQPEPPKFGIQLRLQGGDDVPRSIIFGYTATSGSLAYANTWGTANGVPNAYMTQVIALTDYPVRELVSVEVDGIVSGLGTVADAQRGYPVLNFRKNGVDHLWVKFYDGTQTAPDSFLTGTVSSSARPYNSSRVGYGVPYVIVTAMAPVRQDGDPSPLFSNGFPKFKFALNGARLYDPSRDSSVGGSGTQRWDNPSTWGGDGDFLPIVQAYNVMRGISHGGQWFYGLQNIAAAQLPPAAWIAEINKCRASIAGPDGPEPTYRSGGEVQVGAQVKFSLEAFLTTCQGRLVEIGGTYKPHVGEPGAAVMSFTDGDIISTQEQMFTPFYGLEDTINGIQAKYPSPSEGWKLKTAPPLIRTDLETLAGNRRLLADVTLDFVPYKGQVQRLMKSALLEAQRARRHTFVLGPEFWILEPGDIVQWTSERNGYVSKLMRVDGVADRGDLDVMVDLTEVDPSDYDWNQSTDWRPVVDGPLKLVGTPPLPMIGWQVYGVPVLDDQGRSRRPGIEVWYQPGLQGVREVRVQVRVPLAANPFIDILLPYGPPHRMQIPGNFPPNTDYEVRGIYVRENGDSEWSDWLGVTTPDIKLTPGLDFDPYSGTVGFESLGDDLSSYLLSLRKTARELMEAIQNVDTHLADQGADSNLKFAEVRNELAISMDQVEASFEQVITVGLVPLQNQVVALADWVTNLSAGDGDDVSTARFRMTTQSGPAGYSRIGAETRVDTADPLAWRGAAWFLDTPNDPLLPTRFLVRADQFVVVNSADSAADSPFIFDGTALRVKNALISNLTSANIQAGSIDADRLSATDLSAISANMGTLTAGVITLGGGALVIDGNNVRILVSD